MAGSIRQTLGELGFPDNGQTIPVLYGGSVTSGVIGEFMAEESIDGALVGGASLKPDEMAVIVARASVTAMARGLAG
jgi:triosephosphate isomerase